jgi:hypothetical protein
MSHLKALDLTFNILWVQERNPDILSFSLKKSWQANPSRFPNGATMGRDAHLQSLFYLSSRVPSKGALPLSSLRRAPIERERDAPSSDPLSAISQSLP